jgi:FKBP-type peptidyl-prolyl cis-trans isomerase FkpA
MRKIIVTLFIVLLAVPAFAASDPSTDDQKALYAIGVGIGTNVMQQLEVLNLTAEELDYFKQGFTDKVSGKKIIIDPETHKQLVSDFAQARMKIAVEKEKTRSKDYLENAAKEKGAVKTDSGLIYIPITAGTGKQPKNTDFVKVHYTGTLVDGKEFDSSIKRGQPIEFPLNQVIKCWSEGVS